MIPQVNILTSVSKQDYISMVYVNNTNCPSHIKNNDIAIVHEVPIIII